MNTIRERILIDINGSRYKDFAEHKDLIAFCVSSEYFLDYEDEENSIEPDFNEVIVVVEKDWLFDNIKAMGINDPRDFLQNEYTTEDSGSWFDEALRQDKLVCIMFN